MDRAYSVLVLDNYHLYDEDEEILLEGFPSFEAAREYARRRTRDSLEELRKPEISREELRYMWFTFGESAQVTGGSPDESYYASSDLDYFIDNPSTPEERDWVAFAKQLGVRVVPNQKAGD